MQMGMKAATNGLKTPGWIRSFWPLPQSSGSLLGRAATSHTPLQRASIRGALKGGGPPRANRAAMGSSQVCDPAIQLQQQFDAGPQQESYLVPCGHNGPKVQQGEIQLLSSSSCTSHQHMRLILPPRNAGSGDHWQSEVVATARFFTIASMQCRSENIDTSAH
jgi:hypothetical protein